MSISINNGRLCNKVISNLATSFIAEKFNLFVEYDNYEDISNKLGIILFVGDKKFDKKINLTENNYMEILNRDSFNNNFLAHGYFQTSPILDMIFRRLRSERYIYSITEKNPFKERYKNNNDLFVHYRLGDIARENFHIGLEYYIKCIENINFNNIYIASDSLDHDNILKLLEKYPKAKLVDKNPVETIQFGSTCNNIILSHGTYSLVIGMLSFFSENIYFNQEKCRWFDSYKFHNKNFKTI